MNRIYLVVVLPLLLTFHFFAPHLAAQSAGIVISQVYGGGGNSGATLRNDFVELFNRGNSPITITGWSIQYASASGSSWVRTLLSGAIQPGQYYLVQEHAQGGGSVSLPTPELSDAIDLSATDGKIALVNNSTLLSGTAPSGSQIIDFFGYGSANASEGSPAAALSNTTAAIRQSGGCTDTNNNRADFSVGSPSPRNSHSQVNLCAPAVVKTPTISSISPGTPTVSASNQTVSVFGSQFQSGLTVTVGSPGGGGTTLSGTQIQSVSASSFQMAITLGTAGTYTIKVNNPDGGQSNTFSFNVGAAQSTPSISSISPSSPTASGSNQTVSVFGGQFQSGLTVTVFLPNGSGSSTLSGTQIQGVGATSFQMIIALSVPGTFGIRVNNPDGGQSSTFNFNVTAATSTPAIDPNRTALNSASFNPGAVAPGSLVSIFGTNFASVNTLADSIPLPTSLANVSVTFNGINASLSGVFHDAVNGDQINVQVPWTVATPATAQVVVTRNAVSSPAQPVSIAAASPGIFAIQLSGGQVVGSGLGQAIAYGNSDGIIAAPVGAITGLATHPAKINDPSTLVILATGLGPVDTTVKNGDVPAVITSITLTKPTVTIGDVPAQVVFSGMVGRDASGKALGFVGVYQINVIVAPGTPTGNAVKLQISMNGVTSRPDVTIAVSQ